jgi:hypothetical protein
MNTSSAIFLALLSGATGLGAGAGAMKQLTPHPTSSTLIMEPGPKNFKYEACRDTLQELWKIHVNLKKTHNTQTAKLSTLCKRTRGNMRTQTCSDLVKP